MRIPAAPGLTIAAPQGNPWWSPASTRPEAAFRCLCGHTRTAAGAEVPALLAEWDLHAHCSPHRTALAALAAERRAREEKKEKSRRTADRQGNPTLDFTPAA